MKTTLAGTLLLLATSFASAQFANDRNTGMPPANDGLAGVLKDLQEARDVLKKMPANANRDRIELLLTRAELQLKQLASNLGGAKPVPMGNEDFNRFSISLRNQAFDKDKYTFLENFMAGRFVNCQQAAVLLKHFSFDTDRVKAAVFLHGRLTDVENFHRVLEVFTFDTSKKNVMEQVKQRK